MVQSFEGHGVLASAYKKDVVQSFEDHGVLASAYKKDMVGHNINKVKANR